jgi:hypothetical protein
MLARDLYYDCVRQALISDGWMITHDPYTIPFGLDKVYVDLAAGRRLATEKDGERIAEEIKTFLGLSPLCDDVYGQTFRMPIVELPAKALAVPVLVFDPIRKVVLQWTK